MIFIIRLINKKFSLCILNHNDPRSYPVCCGRLRRRVVSRPRRPLYPRPQLYIIFIYSNRSHILSLSLNPIAR